MGKRRDRKRGRKENIRRKEKKGKGEQYFYLMDKREIIQISSNRQMLEYIYIYIYQSLKIGFYRIFDCMEKMFIINLSGKYRLKTILLIFLMIFRHLFIWLCQGLAAAFGIFVSACRMSFQLQQAHSQLRHVGSSSLDRNQTQAPYIGSTKSQSLDHQGSPSFSFFKR